MRAAAAAGKSAAAAAADAGGDEGFFKAYIETILGNLQLSITNVHVRFEGELPAAGADGRAARFAAGITLQELSAITTDSSGAEAFEAKARPVMRLLLCALSCVLTCTYATTGSCVAVAQARVAKAACCVLRPFGALPCVNYMSRASALTAAMRHL